jgi:hypothetical protein
MNDLGRFYVVLGAGVVLALSWKFITKGGGR